MTTTYRAIINRIDPRVNAAGVEASMRLQHGTLDHLAQETFRDEIEIAKQCETREPGFLRECARSHGMAAEYQEDEEKLKPTRTELSHRTTIRPAVRHPEHTAADS